MWPAIVRFDEPTMSQAVDDALTRIVAIVGLGGIALIHILQAPEAFEEEGYLGALFVVAVVAGIGLAALLTLTADQRVLEAAGGLAGLILIGYLLSRTTGLPGATYDVGEWTEPLGLASMVVEGLVVCVAAGALATRREMTAVAVARPLATRERRAPGATAG